MAINLAIRWSHPNATAALVRYARVDNTSSPVYTTITPNPAVSPNINVLTVATNLPNGQYEVQATPIYADGRSCAASVYYTPECPGLVAINAYVNAGNVIVTWTADPSIPKARITVNFPGGGQSISLYSNVQTVNTTAISIPPGNSGQITVFGQSVCDESTGFYSAASNQVTVDNNTGTTPLPGQYTRSNNIDNICNEAPIVLYTNGAFGIGSVLYQDSGLTTPMTGFIYVSLVSSKTIYTVSTTTGTVLTESGQSCNVIVANEVLTNNYKINAVTGVTGFVLPGGGVPSTGVGPTYYGTRTGSGSLTITVNVTSNVGASGGLSLFRNGVLVQCLTISGDGSYSFAAASFVSTDILQITAHTGVC